MAVTKSRFFGSGGIRRAVLYGGIFLAGAAGGGVGMRQVKESRIAQMESERIRAAGILSREVELQGCELDRELRHSLGEVLRIFVPLDIWVQRPEELQMKPRHILY